MEGVGRLRWFFVIDKPSKFCPYSGYVEQLPCPQPSSINKENVEKRLRRTEHIGATLVPSLQCEVRIS